jgi:hypothetical protein
MEDASQNGSIRPVEATHFVINMLSLCIFPVIATPIVSGIIFRNNDKEYKQFLLKRKEVVSEFIINALKI